MKLKFSIIVNTYNRAESLKNTLDAFSYLRYEDFEVIVVNGPSTDHTEQLLQKYAGKIKIGHCTETNLSKSRNIGIGLASGDIICFIDDDGIPEPDWLDALARVYHEDTRIGAAGGFVRDHTGVDYQCLFIVCNRVGDANFYDKLEDVHISEEPYADHYYSLIGVNSSFRRQALLEISGFDEEYAYFLDETDVCVRLVDAGWKIRFVPDAEVHHKYAPSHLRNEKKIPTSLYYTCRSKVYFQFRNALPKSLPNEIFRQAIRVKHQIQWDINHLLSIGCIDSERHARLSDDIRRGFYDGIRDAYAHPSGQPMPTSVLVDAPFLPFQSRLPASKRSNLILITQDYPPNSCGGIGVFINILAIAMAEAGHEVSVITKSNGRHTVDMIEGVWVHRVPVIDHGSRSYPKLPNLPRDIRNHAYTVYDEALRIQARRGPSTTISAIWDLEAAACVASKAFFNLVYLVTTYQLSLDSKPEWQKNLNYLKNHVEKMISGERWLLENAQQLIASTPGILADVTRLNPGYLSSNVVPVIPFGLPAALKEHPQKPQGYLAESTNILFVGRFEKRKGADLLLDAIPEILKRHPSLHFRLVGDTTINVGDGTLKQRFLEKNTGNLDVLNRVHFLGFVDQTTLNSEYANCDIFVAPSRYESFGLIYLEAMRWGKPCIGANVGGIPDVLTPDCGLLPEPGNLQALVHSIENLITNSNLRFDLGVAGKQRFIKEYSIASFIDRLQPILDRAVINSFNINIESSSYLSKS